MLHVTLGSYTSKNNYFLRIKESYSSFYIHSLLINYYGAQAHAEKKRTTTTTTQAKKFELFMFIAYRNNTSF